MAAFAQDQKEKQARVHVCYAPGRAQAEQMVAVLRLHGINAGRQGGVRDIYSVGETVGEEIVVPPESLEKARDLLSQMTGNAIQAPEKDPSKKKGLISLLLSAGALILLLLLRKWTV